MYREDAREDRPVIGPNFGRLEGKKAWRQNLQLAVLSAAKVETTLGPMGAYKMVTFTRGPERVIKVTKDAVEVLRELEVQYPAVKTLAEAAKVHRQDVGDGTSTFVLILAGLLTEAEGLVAKKIHPNVILKGYLTAAKEAVAVVEKAALPDKVTDGELLEMADCGRGVLTQGVRAALKEAVARAEKQGGVDLKRIRVLSKSGGSVADSKLIRGVVLRKPRVHPSMPDELRGVKVALVNKPLDVKPLELLMKGVGAFPIKLNVTDQGQRQRFRAEEMRMNSDLVQRIASTGARVVVCRGKIMPVITDQLSRAGMMAFEMIDQVDMDAVAEATGATAVGDVRNMTTADLGTASVVRVEKIEGIDYAMIEAEKGSTLLLRGSSVEDVEDLERVVQNAVRIIRGARKDARAVWGGGAIYMQIATRLREYALEFPGKEQAAIMAYADAMERVPAALIKNFGLAYSTALPQIRSSHARGENSVGIGEKGCADMSKPGGAKDMVLTTKYILSRSYEVARLMLRIDEYFYIKDLALVHKQV